VSELPQASPSTTPNFPSLPTRVDSLFEIIAFTRRWTQAPLNGGDRWLYHLREQPEFRRALQPAEFVEPRRSRDNQSEAYRLAQWHLENSPAQGL